MNKDQLLQYIIDNGLFKKKQTFMELFTITKDYTIFKLEKDTLRLKETGELITFYKPGKPLLNMADQVTLKSNSLLCLKEDIDTTIGRAMFNYLAIDFPLNGKINYINNLVNLNYFTDVTALNALRDNVITVDEYLKLSVVITYLRTLSRYLVVANTKKTMLPPPNIKKLREAKVKELTDKYGPDALKDYKHLVELTNYLKDIDNAWLKGDPTDGGVTSGKLKNISRAKKFLIYGDEPGMTEESTEANVILSSLAEGSSKNPTELALRFNSIRSGSFSRGNEIKLAGVDANILTRALSEFSLYNEEDCGTSLYRNLLVTVDNIDFLKHRTIVKGKLAIGNVIGVRAPHFCIAPGNKLCKACLDSNMAGYNNPIGLIGLEIGGSIKNAFMQKMHGTSVTVTNIELNDV